jgi:plastocyanin
MPPRRRASRGPRAAAVSAAVAVMAALGAACISDRAGPASPDDTLACVVPFGAFGPDREVVLIRDFAFVPDTVRVRPGTTITWVSCEPAAREAHTVTAANGAWGSGTLPAGARFERRFDATGVVPYFCVPHPHMRGVVIVE